MPRRSLASMLASCGVAVAACGGGGSPPSTTTETPQPPAPIPQRWHRHLDARDGLKVGVPHGWKLGRRRGSLFLTSPRRQVAVSITARRTGDALAVPLARYARAVSGVLPGYRRPPRVTAARPFGGTPLDGYRVSARGTAANGVSERLAVVVLRHDHLATFTVVAAASRAARPPERARAMAIVRSLRDRPIVQSRSGRSG